MAYPSRTMDGERGDRLVTENAVTLADYTAAGTVAPVVGDIVTPTATGNWFVARAADNDTKRLGVVTKIDKAPSGTDTGFITVAWVDAQRVVALPTDDATTVTLLKSLIKDGDTSVAANVDGAASTGPAVCVSKSGTSGAVTCYAMVFGA